MNAPNTPLAPFVELAGGPCAAPDDMLLALSAEFRPVDAPAARARLDDDARRLFGVAALDPVDIAARLGEVLRLELGMRTRESLEPDVMYLDRVHRRRIGHPVVVAALGVELLRRAGIHALVCSSPTRWFVGIERDGTLALLDARLEPDAPPAPRRVRRHCTHEVAFCSLTGLATRLANQGRRADARHALALRLELPVDDQLRAAIRRELEAF
jgi:hypothetical protein